MSTQPKFKILGRVHKILPQESGVSQTTGKPWIKQDFIIETNSEFPKRIIFTGFGTGKIETLKELVIGLLIEIEFTIESKLAKNGLWYTNLNVWSFINKSGMNQTVNVDPNEDIDQSLPF